MADQLLSDILEAEREIRLQIDALELQIADRLEKLLQELGQARSDDSRVLEAEREQTRTMVEQTARREADVLLTEARAFAMRMEILDTRELDSIVLPQLARILPEGTP